MLKQNFKKAVLISAMAASFGLSTSSNASIIDTPVFQVLGAVIVWGGDNSGTNGSVRDFIIDTAGGNVDLIAGNVIPVMTGTLNSYAPAVDGIAGLSVTNQTLTDANSNGVIDAGDSFSAFAPSETLGNSLDDQKSSFYVASNTAFTIKATAVNHVDSTGSLADITRTMTVKQQSANGDTVAFGSASQLPNTGGAAAGITANGTLNALSTETVVFTGDQRTANAAGTIAEQSVEFTNTYALANGVDLTNGTGLLAATVTYTIAIP